MQIPAEIFAQASAFLSTIGLGILLVVLTLERRKGGVTKAALVLAALFIIRGGINFTNRAADRIPQSAADLLNSAMFFELLVLPTLALFVFTFWRPASKHFWTALCGAVLAAGILEAIYFSDPCLARCHEADGTADFGPLGLFAFASPLAAGIAGVLIAFIALRSGGIARGEFDAITEYPRKAAFLVSAGLLIDAFVQGSILLGRFVSNPAREVERLTPFEMADLGAFISFTALLPALLGAGLLFATARRYDMKGWAGTWFILFTAASLSGAAVGSLRWLQATFLPPSGPVVMLLLALWSMAIPVTIAYAIYRYRLFNLTTSQKRIATHGPLAFLALVFLTVASYLVGGYLGEASIIRGGFLLALGIALFIVYPIGVLEVFRTHPRYSVPPLIGAIALGFGEVWLAGEFSVLISTAGTLLFGLLVPRTRQLGVQLTADVTPSAQQLANMSPEAKRWWMEALLTATMRSGNYGPDELLRLKQDASSMGIKGESWAQVEESAAQAAATKPHLKAPTRALDEPVNQEA